MIKKELKWYTPSEKIIEGYNVLAYFYERDDDGNLTKEKILEQVNIHHKDKYRDILNRKELSPLTLDNISISYYVDGDTACYACGEGGRYSRNINVEDIIVWAEPIEVPEIFKGEEKLIVRFAEINKGYSNEVEVVTTSMNIKDIVDDVKKYCKSFYGKSKRNYDSQELEISIMNKECEKLNLHTGSSFLLIQNEKMLEEHIYNWYKKIETC